MKLKQELTFLKFGWQSWIFAARNNYLVIVFALLEKMNCLYQFPTASYRLHSWRHDRLSYLKYLTIAARPCRLIFRTRCWNGARDCGVLRGEWFLPVDFSQRSHVSRTSTVHYRMYRRLKYYVGSSLGSNWCRRACAEPPVVIQCLRVIHLSVIHPRDDTRMGVSVKIISLIVDDSSRLSQKSTLCAPMKVSSSLIRDDGIVLFNYITSFKVDSPT